MKTSSALFLTFAASASAFALTSIHRQSKSTHLNAALNRMEWKGIYTNLEDDKIVDKIPSGDKVFDPFGFTEGAGLYFYREAEIKHARLAMLAAASWPIAEALNRPLAEQLGAAPVVDAASRNPNILNGGLDKINPLFWVAILGAATVIDLYQINSANNPANEEYFPGNLGFDPLGFYPKDKKGQLDMQQKEINNGRLAMIAVAGFVAQEFVSQSGLFH